MNRSVTRSRSRAGRKRDAPAARLFVLDAPPAAVAALARHADLDVLAVRAEWEPWPIADPAPGPDDVILIWIVDRDRVPLERINALHGHHPRVPLLARVPHGVASMEPLLLSAGVQEIIHGARELARVLPRARGRVEMLGTADRHEPGHSAAAYEGLFPNLYDWIYVVDVAEDGSLSFETINPPLHATGDFLNPDFVGRAPTACLPPERAGVLREHLDMVLMQGSPLQFEEEQHGADGTRSFRTILTPIRNKWGRFHRVAGISRDTTALREAQAALRASEERLAFALEGTQQGLWDWDLSRGVVYRSPRWFEMLGLTPDDVDDTIEAGLARIHPDDRDAVDQAIRLHVDGHLPRIQVEYRMRTGSGDWLWLFDGAKVVSWTPEGAPARITGLCTDITERRRAEESLRALVGGVVHEMRNPAFGIGMNLDALEATFGDEERYRPFVGALRESCNRILGLMNDLRDYGEPRTLRTEPCRVRSVIEDAAQSCDEVALARGVSVVIDFADPALILPLHAFRIRQVFRNLIENAVFHAPPSTEVRVTSRSERVGDQAWAVFTVEDEGPGFDAEALTRAFEPFFTRRRGGTGLGLSIVLRIIEEHAGMVSLANRGSGGAIVTVRLPIPRALPERTDG